MKDNRHLVGSGGGTRTPDTRIMIVTLDSDQTPLPRLNLHSQERAGAAFLILPCCTSLRGATLNHMHFGHPVVTHTHGDLAEISLCSPPH